MAPRKERLSTQAKGKWPRKEETHVVSRKARGFANSMLLTLEQKKKLFLKDFLERKIVPGKNIHFYELPKLRLVKMFHKMD